MSFSVNRPVPIQAQGDLSSNTLLDAVYELDQDLTTVKNEVASTSGNMVVQDTQPTSTSNLWIDTSEN